MIPPRRPRGPARSRRVVPLVVLLLLGCSSPPRQGRSTPDSGAPSPPVADTAPAAPAYRLQFGEGGGFTGEWRGYTMERDGTVLQWRGRGPDDAPSDTVGVLSEEGRLLVWQELTKAGFFTATADERGNMTRFIRVEAAADTHQLTWSYRPVADTLATGKSWIACEAAVLGATPLPGR